MVNHEHGIRELPSLVGRIETEAASKLEAALGSAVSKFIELGSRVPVITTGLAKSEHACTFHRSYLASDQHSVATEVT
jgi:hypothetical protein